jgi:hypothetical protein
MAIENLKQGPSGTESSEGRKHRVHKHLLRPFPS